MTYPILEHDPTREAMIEPARFNQPRDGPQHCVICFFKEVIDTVAAERSAKVLATQTWEDGPHPLYEIEHQGQRLAFFHPGVGAPSHTHEFEEILTIVEGTAEVWLDNARQVVGPGTTIFVRTGAIHGFLNVGSGPLKLQAVIAATELRATFLEPPPSA